MDKKYLVTYATKLGSTTEIARVIGKTISQKGIMVDVTPIQNVTTISNYAKIIIGSAVRMGSWLPEAMNFVKKQQNHLKNIPTAIFTVHILNQGDDPESEKERLAYTIPIREIVAPKTEAFFPGKIDSAELSFLERLLFKAVKSPSGDFRNWEEIQDWAKHLV